MYNISLGGIKIVLKKKSSILIFCLLLVLFLINSNNCRIKNESLSERFELNNLDNLDMNSEILADAFQKAEDLGFVYGMIIQRRGQVAGEYYFHGYNKDSAFNIKSVSKSILSALVGIAFEKGFIKNLDRSEL